MTREELHQHMTTLYKTDIDKKVIIAKAVQLGMDYQEQLIKVGIDAIFETLHAPTKIMSK